jgi:hypothetical protein
MGNIDWGSILPWAAFGFSIVSLIITFVFNYLLRKWEYRQEYKIKFIDQLYPDLIKELRNVIDEYNKLWIYSTKLDIKLNVLNDLFKSGRINYIKTIDLSLYNNLEFIKNDLELKIKEIFKKRDDKVNTTISDWKLKLYPREMGSSINQVELASIILKRSLVFIGNGEYNKISEIYEEEAEKIRENMPEKLLVFDVDAPKKLIEIAKIQFNELVELDKELSKQLKKVVEISAINKMLYTLTKPI